MKTCPFCAEEIQDLAVKCKHCFEFLDESKRPMPPPIPGYVKRDDGVAWYFKTSFIILTFCTLPPLALPSVWWHPRLHVVWKAVITVAALGLCWLSVIAIQGLMKQLDEATKMLNEMKM